MINRNCLVCLACETKIVVRTAVGHGFRQEHGFDCPGCGVEIRYVLEIDQENVRLNYREPYNARWSESEDGASSTLSFDAETLVPKDLAPVVSPFIATFFNIQDIEKYREDEAFRQMWREKCWPILDRLMTHWERANATLFDQDLGKLGIVLEEPTHSGRLETLFTLLERGFSYFTLWSTGSRSRVRQRAVLASSINHALVERLAQDYVTSGRAATLWRQLKDVRRLFLRHYSAMLPIIRFRYWKESARVAGELELSEKRFGELRQLYVDSFETLCRLSVVAVGFEEIIDGGRLSIPTSKGQISLWDFEAMPNGSKANILNRYPIADLLVGALDHKLRNGVGHHAAHFAAASDEVVYYESKGPKTVERRMMYTQFVEKSIRGFPRPSAVLFGPPVSPPDGGRGASADVNPRSSSRVPRGRRQLWRTLLQCG